MSDQTGEHRAIVLLARRVRNIYENSAYDYYNGTSDIEDYLLSIHEFLNKIGPIVFYYNQKRTLQCLIQYLSTLEKS